MRLAILKGFNTWEESFRKACEESGVEYVMVDIRRANWMENLKAVADSVDGFLVSPPCLFHEYKEIYDERLYFIHKYFNKPICPDFNACYIYENKRNMAAFLEFYDIPHAKTMVFTDKSEAMTFLDKTAYPLVVKSNTGAGGQTVEIVKSRRKAKKIANQSFGRKNGLLCSGRQVYVKKLGIPMPVTGWSQKHYLLVQEYHPIKWEWRILKIGDSYFGHQKLLKGEKASGSGLVGWVMPPVEVLDLAKSVCDKGGFDVMDVDILETVDGRLLVNELQAQFGSYLDYQMKVDGKPGRLIYTPERGFVFEEGVFNRYNSKLLVVKAFLKRLAE